MALSTENKSLAHLAEGEEQCAEKVVKHMNKRGIITPDDFASQLILAHRTFRATPFSMSRTIVKAVIDACEYWEDYVLDWDDFVCRRMLSMAKINTSVVNLYFLKKQRIPLKKEPSLFRETIVEPTGTIKFFDR